MPETSPSAFDAAVARVRSGADLANETRELVKLLSTEERLHLLDGDLPFWAGMGEMLLEGYNMRPLPMGRVDRIGLPGIQFTDGPRGVVVGQGTAFPVPSSRAASFDVELEERIGVVIGEEGRARGANYFAGVCINLPRNPAWGRSQESFGEEPALLGEFGAALTRGTRQHLMACAKHFALNSMENARFSVDVAIDEADLHEYYLPHFKRVVEEGADSIMSAYNSVNGEWAGQNTYLLTTVLRDDWGFKGFVLSDFIWGLRDAARSLEAGLDIEAPFSQQRAHQLPSGIENGTVALENVERAALRIVERQLALYARRSTEAPAAGTIASDLALESALRSMILLRNEILPAGPALPLPTDSRIAVFGRLANIANTGDHGSSDVRAPYVVTFTEGLAERFINIDIDTSGEADSSAAVAESADAAIVVVGYTAAEEGEFVGGEIFSRADLDALYPPAQTEQDQKIERELRESAASGRSVVGAGTAGGDRTSLRLLPADVALIQAVAAVNPRTVVVVVAGNSVIVEEWIDDVQAVVFSGYAGMEGGHALAALFAGTRDFTGRLPFVIPTDPRDLAPFDINAVSIRYDGSFGQRRLDSQGISARFPFGFGLSYGDCSTELLAASRSGDTALVQVRVHNRSSIDTHHVIQLYGQRNDGQQFLVGFASLAVPAQSTVEGEVTGRLEYLGRWDAHERRIQPPRGEVTLGLARFWGDPEQQVVIV